VVLLVVGGRFAVVSSERSPSKSLRPTTAIEKRRKHPSSPAFAARQHDCNSGGTYAGDHRAVDRMANKRHTKGNKTEMASVHPRKDRNGRRIGWEARWRDPETRKHRSKTFRRREEAKAHGNKMETSKREGTYIDDRAGRIAFEDYAEQWRKAQVHRDSTAAQARTHLGRHVYPRIGQRAVASIRPSEIQALVKSCSADLAPSTVAVIHSWVSGVFKAAVADHLIASSPCAGTKLPTIERPKVVPLAADKVREVVETIDPRFRALVVLGAGTGMRISEALGVTVDRIDFLRREIKVDRQLVRTAGAAPLFGPLKDRKNRPRTIPVGAVVIDALAEQLATYGPAPKGLCSRRPSEARWRW
jgi:integrase